MCVRACVSECIMRARAGACASAGARARVIKKNYIKKLHGYDQCIQRRQARPSPSSSSAGPAPARGRAPYLGAAAALKINTAEGVAAYLRLAARIDNPKCEGARAAFLPKCVPPLEKQLHRCCRSKCTVAAARGGPTRARRTSSVGFVSPLFSTRRSSQTETG